MMKEKEALEVLFMYGYLNENGLRQYVGYLRGDIKVLSDDTKKICSKKGLKRQLQRSF